MGRFDNIEIVSPETNKQKKGRFSDIEIVSGKLELPEKPEGTIKKLTKAAASPFTKTAATGIRAAQAIGKTAIAGGQRLLGDKQGAIETITEAGQLAEKPVNFPFFGETKPVTTPKESIGVGLQLGTSLVGGSGALGRGALGATSKVLARTPKIASPLARLAGSKTAGVATEFAGLSGGFELGRQIEEGEPLSAKKIATSAAAGAALPIAGKLAKGTIKTTGKLGAEILGTSTGAGSTSFRRLFNNPEAIQFNRLARKEGSEEMIDTALNATKTGLSKLAEKRLTEYRKILEKIKLDRRQQDEILNGVRSKVKNVLLDRGISVKKQGGALGKTLNEFDFSKSTIVSNEESIQRAFNEVLNWNNTTAEGLDVLKKRLQEYIDGIPEKKAPAKSMLIDIKNNLVESLNKNVDGYAEMTRSYAKAKQLEDEITRALSISNKNQKETAVRKLLQTMRRDDDSRRTLLMTLEDITGEPIQDRIVGALTAQGTPRGLVGALTPGLSAGAIISPASIPALMPVFAMTSPKLMAEFVAILGRINQQMTKTGQLSPQIQTALRLLLQQAIEELNQKPTESK